MPDQPEAGQLEADQPGDDPSHVEVPTGDPAPRPHRLEANRVSVRRRRTWLLPPTSLSIVSGEVTLAVGEPDDRHAFLALAVAGRLSGYDGEVRFDDAIDARRLQRRVALVDVVGVTSPEPVLPVRAVIGEEMAMSGRRAWRRNVEEWLAGTDLGLDGTELVGDIEPAVRVTLLTELALLRNPAFVVLALPERHGALPAGWWHVAESAARRGPGVLVTASPTAAAHVVHPDRRAGIGPDQTDPAIGTETDTTGVAS